MLSVDAPSRDGSLDDSAADSVVDPSPRPFSPQKQQRPLHSAATVDTADVDVVDSFSADAAGHLVEEGTVAIAAAATADHQEVAMAGHQEEATEDLQAVAVAGMDLLEEEATVAAVQSATLAAVATTTATRSGLGTETTMHETALQKIPGTHIGPLRSIGRRLR